MGGYTCTQFIFIAIIINTVKCHIEDRSVDLLMPGAVSLKPDELVCHSVRLNSSFHQYILEYVPKASKDVAHHMVIYGCETPGSTADKWTCGGMERSEPGVCGGNGRLMKKRIVYAWALNAPKKTLPDGVGLRVGGDTPIQYLVLQLHYKDAFKPGQVDHSGVTLKITNQKQPHQLGFYVLGNWGFIPPGQQAFHMESACLWRRNVTIYPFAYRTHSHNLGRVTSAYRIRDGIWTEIGRMSPQQPETFYEVTHPGMDIQPGDMLAGRCTMNSRRRTTPTEIGATNHDEMCNFYFMYSTDEQENLNDIYCFRDAQKFHWLDYFKPEEIPADVSNLLGVNLLEPEMEPLDQEKM